MSGKDFLVNTITHLQIINVLILLNLKKKEAMTTPNSQVVYSVIKNS